MRDPVVLVLHLLATVARLAEARGARPHEHQFGPDVARGSRTVTTGC